MPLNRFRVLVVNCFHRLQDRLRSGQLLHDHRDLMSRTKILKELLKLTDQERE
jgi:hypothetical protein